MNKELRDLCKDIRGLSDDDAINWLKNHFPIDDPKKFGKALQIIPHRSWKRSSQLKLLEYYCIRNKSAFCAFPFLQFMSIPVFIKAIKSYLPDDPKRLDLWVYEFKIALSRKKI